MKRKILILLISFCITGILRAQIPSEAFPLTNSLNDLWYNGETEKAIGNTLELYKLYPPFLIDNFHHTLAQKFRNKDEYHNCSVYIEELYQKKNQAINRIITPIYLWSKLIDNADAGIAYGIIDQLNKVLTDSTNFKSHAEAYCLLALNELDSKSIVDSQTRRNLLDKVIHNLENYPFLEQNENSKRAVDRAWNRYLLAYSYFYLYTKFDQEEEYMMKAAKYSPDKNDILVKHAYFYDAVLLSDNAHKLGFKKDYLNVLKAKNKTREALSVLTEIAFGEPSDENMEALKNYYPVISSKQTFNDYWLEYIDLHCKAVPRVIVKFQEGDLDLTKKTSQWIYIDVWGTWCSPCVKELPGLQTFFVSNSKDSNSKLRVLTFSFGSQNLSAFMKDNNYTFPVSEIDKPLNDAFEINSYPTKILITPNGNYLNIPFNTDWTTFIKNYCLM